MPWIGLLVLTATACGIGAGRNEVPTRRVDLTGVWIATMRNESAEVSGIVALFQSAILSDSFGFQIVEGVTQGTFDLQFDALGFKLAGGAALQPATSAVMGDSVELEFNPYVGHGKVVLRGVRDHDRVIGTWSHDGPGGGSGSFELRRVP